MRCTHMFQMPSTWLSLSTTARPSGSAWQSPSSCLQPRNDHNGAFFVEQISNEITGYCPGSKEAEGLHAVALGRTSSSPASSVPKETDLNSLTSKMKLWKWNQMHASPPGLLENAILIPKRVTRAWEYWEQHGTSFIYEDTYLNMYRVLSQCLVLAVHSRGQTNNKKSKI